MNDLSISCQMVLNLIYIMASLPLSMHASTNVTTIHDAPFQTRYT